jgi:hypothetical protein
MNQTNEFTLNTKDNSLISDWFNELISTLRVDELMLTTGTAPTEKTDLYNSLMTNDFEIISMQNRKFSTQFFISVLLRDYITALNAFSINPKRIAFDLSDSKVLVWAEIKDNDEVAEDAFIMAEAKANSKYFNKGFYISSTIVEESDEIEVPLHYHTYLDTTK